MGVANEASCGFASGRGAKGYLARNAAPLLALALSSLLFALEHALAPFGVLTYAVLGASFSIPYVWHKNVYAMMTAHLIVNVVGNGLPLAAMLLLAC